MQAVLMRAFGDEDVLEVVDVEPPVLGAGEALVRVAAVEVSRTRDLATRTGRHPFSRAVTLPHVLGGDFAGVVEDVHPGVGSDLLGSRVAGSCVVVCDDCEACRAGEAQQCPRMQMLGIHRWGSYAERVAVPVTTLRAIPDDLTMEQAAALVATGPIAQTQLQAARAHRADVCLITGATGALATTLALLARRRGAFVVGLSRRPDRVVDPALFDLLVASDVSELSDALREVADGRGIDVVLDNVGDPQTFTRYLPALNIAARIVVSGAVTGTEPPVLRVPVGELYIKSLSLLGVRTARPDDADALWALVGDGLRLPSSTITRHPLTEVAAVHAAAARGETAGHVVLEVGR